MQKNTFQLLIWRIYYIIRWYFEQILLWQKNWRIISFNVYFPEYIFCFHMNNYNILIINSYWIFFIQKFYIMYVLVLSSLNSSKHQR